MAGPLGTICHRYSRITLSLLLIAILAANNALAQSHDSPPEKLTLNERQILEMKLKTHLSSKTAKVDDDIMFNLSEPLVAGGMTLLPAGQTVRGRVTEVKRAEKNCRPGSIRWEFEPLKLAGGQEIEIHFIEKDVATSRPLGQTPHKPNNVVTGKENDPEIRPSHHASVGGILKAIALVPLAVVVVPLLILAEAGGSCSGGKGSEQTLRAGTTTYAEISSVVQH